MFEQLMKEAHQRADTLVELYRQHPSREMSLALTNLEQSVMWATKAFAMMQANSSRIIKDNINAI